MNNQLEEQIDSIAVNVIQHQGFSFSSHHELQRQVEQTRSEIRQSLKQGNALLMQGLTLLKENDCGYVSEICKKLLKHSQSSKKISKIIDTEILNNDRSLSLFLESVSRFHDCGDFYKEECVLTAFISLFPDHPQPYAFYGTLIWRRDGINAADEFYSKLIKVIHEPGLDYFAADCFLKNGNKEKSKNLLQQTLNYQQTTQESYCGVKQKIIDLIQEC